MTIWFFGSHKVYEQYCRDEGIERKRMGRDIICVSSDETLRGREYNWDEDTEVWSYSFRLFPQERRDRIEEYFEYIKNTRRGMRYLKGNGKERKGG